PRIQKQASHLSLLLIRSCLLQGAPAIGKAEEGNWRHLLGAAFVQLPTSNIVTKV
ncbi:hypothetical protein STEG23_011514, partial [Scotinomys teguina]